MEVRRKNFVSFRLLAKTFGVIFCLESVGAPIDGKRQSTAALQNARASHRLALVTYHSSLITSLAAALRSKIVILIHPGAEGGEEPRCIFKINQR